MPMLPLLIRLHKCMFCVCHPPGVVRQVKPLRGPKDFVFQVAVNYVKSGVVSYRNIVIIRFFISEFWF